jgi:hypothetical protein
VLAVSCPKCPARTYGATRLRCESVKSLLRARAESLSESVSCAFFVFGLRHPRHLGREVRSSNSEGWCNA